MSEVAGFCKGDPSAWISSIMLQSISLRNNFYTDFLYAFTICLHTTFDTQWLIFFHCLWVKHKYIYGWIFISWMWQCVTGCVFPDISREHSAFETSGNARWHHHVSEVLNAAMRTFAICSFFRCLGCSTLWHMQQEHTSCMWSGREQESTTRRDPQVWSECIRLLTMWLGHYCEAKRNTVHDPEL